MAVGRVCGLRGEGAGSGGVWYRLLCGLFVLVLVVAAGCGADDSPAATLAVATSAAPASMSDEAMVTTTAMMAVAEESSADVGVAADGESSVAVGLPVSTPADLGRDIVYRGAVWVEAEDIGVAVNQAVSIVVGMGGFVFAQQVRGDPDPWAQFTFKVAPGDFVRVLERLSEVGELVNRTMSADDVTERVVDLESRIATAEASVVRLRSLMEDATDVAGLAALEGELHFRESDLETLRGRLRTLSDQVSLSTIDMTINQLREPVPEAGIDVDVWVAASGEDPCLGSDTLEAAPDDDAYFCVSVENTGEVAITDIVVSSDPPRLPPRAARTDRRSFELVSGSFERIEPGELVSTVLDVAISDGRIAGRVATRGGTEVGFEVSATPVSEDGVPLDPVTGASSAWVVVDEEQGPPSFVDSIRVGYGGLVQVLGYVVAIVGLLLPFVPIVVVAGALYWWIRRWGRGRRPDHSNG
ncbi:MAG: DUF4349 domain-containing protein [Acidimicrobiia bacterium]|nr:DUF4349 domain-containing protein [Acidimicrobiia bacterium]MYF84710.1 DUF4349 domain-containing protein [Acidimicrobiia bacterium]